MDASFFEYFKEGGAVATVAMMLIYLWKRDRLFNKTMNNHLAHDTVAKEKLAVALTRLSDSIKQCPHNNEK